jgi:hypothetical protein
MFYITIIDTDAENELKSLTRITTKYNSVYNKYKLILALPDFLERYMTETNKTENTSPEVLLKIIKKYYTNKKIFKILTALKLTKKKYLDYLIYMDGTISFKIFKKSLAYFKIQEIKYSSNSLEEFNLAKITDKKDDKLIIDLKCIFYMTNNIKFFNNFEDAQLYLELQD